jgi:hypothetical protein
VECPADQSAAGEFAVNLVESEGQNGAVSHVASAEAGAKGSEPGSIIEFHDMLNPFWMQNYVLFLFRKQIKSQEACRRRDVLPEFDMKAGVNFLCERPET